MSYCMCLSKLQNDLWFEASGELHRAQKYLDLDLHHSSLYFSVCNAAFPINSISKLDIGVGKMLSAFFLQLFTSSIRHTFWTLPVGDQLLSGELLWAQTKREILLTSAFKSPKEVWFGLTLFLPDLKLATFSYLSLLWWAPIGPRVLTCKFLFYVTVTLF